MQLKATKLNNERLSGKKLFLHTFKNFSTTSTRTSFKMNVIHGLISILGILGIVYVVAVVFIVSNIINKKEGIAAINEINIKSAKIEKEYNALISTYSKDYALANGFVNVEMNNFASRKDAAASLSFLYESKAE